MNPFSSALLLSLFLQPAKAKAANDVEEAEKQQKICDELTKGAYAKLHHDMQHFVTEASVEQLTAIKTALPNVLEKRKKQVLMRLKFMVTAYLVHYVQHY